MRSMTPLSGVRWWASSAHPARATEGTDMSERTPDLDGQDDNAEVIYEALAATVHGPDSGPTR